MNSEINNALLNAYCERTHPGLWGEPFNALTNLAFIIAGLLAIRLYRNLGVFSLRRHWDFVLLIALLFAIGVGSALWHFVPPRHTILADVIPILVFINVYLLSFLVRVVDRGWRFTAGCYLAFLTINVVTNMAFSRDFLNGSVFYAPAWITLITMGAYLQAIHHRLRKRMLVAGVIFTASLFFRTMDKSVCQWVPEGTHFIWHVLNAWLLYVLAGALFDHQANIETNIETAAQTKRQTRR